MENDEKGQKKPPDLTQSHDGSTRVDLGDDLLADRTRTAIFRTEIGAPSPSPRAPDKRDAFDRRERDRDAIDRRESAPFDADDQFASAKILLGEGLLDDAKKVLRQILVRDPHYAPAILSLREIHETELKQIFGDDPQPRRRRYSTQAPDPVFETVTARDAEEIVRDLDRDMRLGALGGSSTPLDEARADPRELAIFAGRVDERAAALTGPDRVDLGIGFHEMGLYELAVRQFRAAHQYFVRQEEPDHAAALGAGSLLAQSLIAAGHGFEATQEIQAMLRDAEAEAEGKIELLYLMGRAYESLGKLTAARQWYEQAHAVDPFHRDVADRIRELGSE